MAQFNEIQIYEDPTIWYSAFRVTALVDAPAAAGSSFHANGTLLATLLAPYARNLSAVTIRDVSRAESADKNQTQQQQLAAAATLVLTADIVLNGTNYNYTLAEVRDTLAAGVASRPSAFGNATTIRSDMWSVRVAPSAPPPKLPARRYAVWRAWFTVAVVFCLVASLTRHGLVDPDVAIFLALTVLCLSQIITAEDVVHGFANEGIATVGVLFVVAQGIANAGVLDVIMKRLLGTPTNVRVALARLGAPLVFHGLVITNTPVRFSRTCAFALSPKAFTRDARVCASWWPS